jgi:hypothetical protein
MLQDQDRLRAGADRVRDRAPGQAIVGEGPVFQLLQWTDITLGGATEPDAIGLCNCRLHRAHWPGL